MRKIWVKVDPWNKKMVTTALEGGADGIMVPEGFTDKDVPEILLKPSLDLRRGGKQVIW